MSSPDSKWRAERLLAPGKSLDDSNGDGWEMVAAKEGTS